MTKQSPAATAPRYRGAERRIKRAKINSRSRLTTASADNSVSQMDLPRIIRRLAIQATHAPLKVLRADVGLRMEEKHDNPLALNPPYGILPALLSASPEELLEAADSFAVAKHAFTNQGDYYRAWQAGWRQRLCERLLHGITSLELVVN